MSISTNISNKSVYEEKMYPQKATYTHLFMQTFSCKKYKWIVFFNLIIIIKNVFTILMVTKPNSRFRAFFWPTAKLRTPSACGTSNLFFFFIILSQAPEPLKVKDYWMRLCQGIKGSSKILGRHVWYITANPRLEKVKIILIGEASFLNETYFFPKDGECIYVMVGPVKVWTDGTEESSSSENLTEISILVCSRSYSEL